MPKLFRAANFGFLFLLLLVLATLNVSAQTTTFTYQGRFTDSTAVQPTNGTYEMQFKAFDAAANGIQFGGTQTLPTVQVVNGIFTVVLDFGATTFRGEDRFIEISVRPAGSGNPLTTLAPRQQVTSAPFSIQSFNSLNANDSANLGGIAAGNYVQTNDSRLTDARTPTSGSSFYIQNQTGNSQAANFSISGNATVGGTISGNGANVTNLNAGNVATGTLLPVRGGTGLSATGVSGNFLRSNGTNWMSSPLQTTDFPAGSGNYIQNSTALQATSNFNVSGNGTLGGTISANIVNSTTNFRIGNVAVFATPNQSSVVAGQLSNYALTAADSTFIGYKTGAVANGFSQANTFIGSNSGTTTSSGGNNSFVGRDSGFFNSSGSFNSFFGSSAGKSNTIADANSFFGYESGLLNNTGTHNSYFGFQTGRTNSALADNSFFGYQSGNANTGANNSFFGSSSGVVNNSGNNNAFFGSSSGSVNTSGTDNTFVGSKAGNTNISGSNNTLIGFQTGSTGDGNTVVGANSGNTSGINNTIVGLNSFTDGGDNNTVIGYNARVSALTPRSHSTAIGADAVADTGNSIVLGTSLDTVYAKNDLVVTGNSFADNFGGNFLNVGAITATGQIKTVLMSGGATQVCRNAQSILSTCSSSLRYKTNIAPYSGGLGLLNRLNPITFDWKDGGMHDLGFGAEDVAKVDPLLVTYNDSGQIEGVKYDRITTILVNSVKEQQTQIAVQAEQLKQQQKQIEALKIIVCSQNPTVEICQKEK